MVGAFESEAVPLFHTDLPSAESTAIQEATITNGLVQEVNSITISKDNINFIGNVYRGHFLPRLLNRVDFNVPYLIIKVDCVGNFHTTWSNILNNTLVIGYLIFMFPIDIMHQGVAFNDDCDIDTNLIINIQMNKCGKSLNQRSIGPSICSNCGKAIDPKRLLAVPGTLYCAHCMKFIEKGDYGHGKAY